MSQCRCFSKNKTIRVVPCDCPEGVEGYLIPEEGTAESQAILDWAHEQGNLDRLHPTGYHLWASARQHIEGFNVGKIPGDNNEWALMQMMCAAYIDGLPDVEAGSKVFNAGAAPSWYSGVVMRPIGEDNGRLWEIRVTNAPEQSQHKPGDMLVCSRMTFTPEKKDVPA